MTQPRPGADRFPFLDHPGPIPLVHRATTAGHVENTLPAIEAALGLGFRYVETDARTTADGVAVLLHDPDLRRLGSRPERIADLRADAVARLRLGAAGIPRLDEVLGSLPGLRLNIDLKDDASVAAVTAAVTRTGAADRVCVTSFTDRRIRAFRRRMGTRVCTGMGVRVSTALKLSSRLPLARGGLGPRVPGVAQLPLRAAGVPVVDDALLAHAHALGLAVHAWTVNERAEMERLLDAGIDGIVTDEPLLLRTVLGERGLWPS